MAEGNKSGQAQSDAANRSELPITDRTYAAPFGRYQAGGEMEPPADEVLVGREGQRAFFIDLLLRAGRRGAYLITGHRGVGKTSFVRYGLAEYEGEVFERFLRSNVGRSIFWDRIMILAMGLVLLTLALMTSQLMELLVRSASGDRNPGNLLLWSLSFLLLIPCLYPLLFAREIIGEIIEAAWSHTRRERLNAALSTAIVLFLAGFCWYLGPFGSPVESLAMLLLVTSAVFLFIQSTSFDQPSSSLRNVRRVLLVIFAALLSVYLFLPTLLPVGSLLRRGANVSFPIVSLWFTLHLVGLGGALYGFGQLMRRLKTGTTGDTRWNQAVNSGALWYLGPGLALSLASLGYLWSLGLAVAVGLGALILVLASGLFLSFKPWVHPFKPRPCAVLALKALLCTVLTLQLAFPMLVRFSWPIELGFIRIIAHALPSGAEPAGNALHTMANTAGPKGYPEIFLHHAWQEIEWIFFAFLCLGLVYFLEYEWVVRPFLRQRNDPVIDPAAKALPAGSRSPFRNLAKITLPWLLYKTWLPMITVAVNLGFERLDHRRVVQAMLTGLRTQYHRKFLAWNSALANLGRIFRLVALAIIVVWAGEKFFALPTLPPGTEWLPVNLQAKDLDWYSYRDVCKLLEGYQGNAGAASLVCQVKYGDAFFHFLYYDLAGSEIKGKLTSRDEHLLLFLVPFASEPWPSWHFLLSTGQPEARPFVEPGLHFRVYHLLLIVLLIFLGRWLTRKLPVPAYRGVLRQIDEVIDNLISSTSTTSRVGRWQPIQWLEGLFLSEKVRETQQDPFDPRTVEFMFLNILEEMQEATVRLPGARNQILSLPVPEITFFFDELDKLGTRVEPQSEGETVGQDHQREILNAERRRSLELHRLLADMKNLLSSAPARFIFVGGRNLHDEWLADQTARQPLLTNIFVAEIYLPSLLTDHSRREKGGFGENVRIYVKAQKKRATVLYDRFHRKLALPSPALPVESGNRERFVVRDTFGGEEEVLEILNPKEKTESNRAFKGQLELNRDFFEFLTYRSLGNPKRLKELLASFVRPVGRVVGDPGIRDQSFRCDHVLSFDETDRFRIQLLAAVYRHLQSSFETGFAKRDDKLTVTMFHLADFLLKFHRRAFSWTNLERVEDLVHIHRAPDLRELLEDLVEGWSERFLHRIRNGMYDFRFRSAFALELQHISRQSPEEMAAFNFTLDESQALKSIYEMSIRRLKEEKGQELQDIVAGLGELHEFDQEYDTARFYYRRAIVLLDAELRELTGGSLVFEKSSPMMQTLKGDPVGEETARLFMSWGIARLRLILQIGMTFELSRNFERAEVEYQNARALARALLLSMLDQKPGKLNVAELPWEGREEHRLHALKHLNLIFQPVFAEVWLAEKFGAGVDTSVALVEKELDELRRLLPFVRDGVPELSLAAVQRRHATFALIGAELHDKAGDLYFFKGRQTVRLEDLERMKASMKAGTGQEILDRRADGYLLRAHYHYAVALHELRRFTTYRKRSSRYKWNIFYQNEEGPDSASTWDSISRQSWPDFVYRSAGGSFSDIAEAMLGRVSLYGLFLHLSQKNIGVSGQHETNGDVLIAACTDWMEGAQVSPSGLKDAADGSIETREIAIPLGEGRVLNAGALNGWLGEWNGGQRKDSDPLIRFHEKDCRGDVARLTVGLNLMRVGAKYLETGGYVEEAARESLLVAEAVSHYLWWSLAIRRVLKLKPPEDVDVTHWAKIRALREGYKLPGAKRAYWTYLLRLGTHSLQKADRLFRQGRRAEKKDSYLVVDKVPANAVTLACSLGLAAILYSLDDDGKQLTSLEDLLRGWRGSALPERDPDWAYRQDDDSKIRREKQAQQLRYLKGTLEDSLIRHSFPVLNRLHGLKVLIDAEVIRDIDGSELDTVLARTKEWLDLANKVNDPLHFTPLQTGTTCALVYLCYYDHLASPNPDLSEASLRIQAVARRDLLSSEQMSTMRRAFYENISNLFYLYDDFNDRQLHFNHSMQLAGLEYVSLMRTLMKCSERPDLDRPVFLTEAPHGASAVVKEEAAGG